jgi:hypothetical protein
LIVVITPTIENVFTVTVKIDEEAYIGESVEYPLGIFTLRLRKGRRSMINFIFAWVGGSISRRRWTEICREVPEKVVVAIYVDSDATPGWVAA